MTIKINDEMKKELNREIRAFNKTITTSTTNKEIWNKKVELSKKYGLEIKGRYCSEKYDKYLKISTMKKNEVCLYIVVEPKPVKIGKCNITEIIIQSQQTPKGHVNESLHDFFVYFCLQIKTSRNALWRLFIDPYIYILDNKKHPGDVLERKKL